MLSGNALMTKYNAMPSSDKELVTSLVICLEEGEIYRKGSFWEMMGAMSFRTPEFILPFHIMTDLEQAAYMCNVWDEISSFKKNREFMDKKAADG